MKNYYQLNQVIKLRHWRMSFFFILVEYSKNNGQYNDRFQTRLKILNIQIKTVNREKQFNP